MWTADWDIRRCSNGHDEVRWDAAEEGPACWYCGEKPLPRPKIHTQFEKSNHAMAEHGR